MSSMRPDPLDPDAFGRLLSRFERDPEETPPADAEKPMGKRAAFIFSAEIEGTRQGRPRGLGSRARRGTQAGEGAAMNAESDRVVDCPRCGGEGRLWFSRLESVVCALCHGWGVVARNVER